MNFSIYGRVEIEIGRENDAWVAYRSGSGKRARTNDLVIPPTLTAGEIAVSLDALYRELSGPGRRIERR